MTNDNRKTRSNPGNPRIVGEIIRNNGCLQIRPCDKKQRFILYNLKPENMNGASVGDVVMLEPMPSSSVSPNQAKVIRVLGQRTSPGILSLVSLCEKGLSETFSQAALDETKGMTVPSLQGREDLRAIPLVTIDGADSRDFDDAVFAEKTADGGHHLIVAIADVSWYVRPGSALDKEAYARGNSTYFPDRVLPMLPEALSNDLCSLKPNVDRAVMAYHMWIDKDGTLTNKKINRALMRSAARLTYEQVQRAKDGKPDNITTPLMNNVINPLYEAYAVLRQARDKRGALDLDQPEFKVAVNNAGAAADVDKYIRRDSNKLIEEFMILSNVAAPVSLEEKQSPCVYRVHDAPPSANKVEALRENIGHFGLALPAGEIKDASAFKDVLAKAASIPNGHMIAKAIQRVQAKAVYDSKNIGHFGLALTEYAHVTSPIRRYADLVNHRLLVDAFNMGAGGMDSSQKAKLQETAEHISETENLSAKAARSAHDRLSAAFFATQIGRTFTGRIASVTNAGAFIRLDKSGADGLMLMRDLPRDNHQDHYDFDKDKQTLSCRSGGRVFRVGDTITARIKDADGLSGSILLAAANDNNKSAVPNARPHKNNGYKPK